MTSFGRRIVFIASFLAAWSSRAATELRAADPSGSLETTLAAAEDEHSALVTEILRAHLPHDYENTKRWGQTKQVLDGWHVARDGLRLKTKRKYKDVNHGTWTRYHVKLTDPDSFRLRIAPLKAHGDGRVALTAEIFAPLWISGRISQWNHGVQLFSLSAVGDAKATLTVTCAVRLRLDGAKKLVPDVIVEPEVLSAELAIDDFHLHEISKLDGPVVKELGREARRFIDEEVAERNASLATKLNAQLAKRKDKLRFSLTEISSSKFGDLTRWLAPSK